MCLLFLGWVGFKGNQGANPPLFASPSPYMGPSLILVLRRPPKYAQVDGRGRVMTWTGHKGLQGLVWGLASYRHLHPLPSK